MQPNHMRTYRALLVTPRCRTPGSPGDSPAGRDSELPPVAPAWAGAGMEEGWRRARLGANGTPATGVPVATVAPEEEEEEADRVQVICPEGRSAGEALTVSGPDGEPLTFVIPEGVSPGQGFGVSVEGAVAVWGAPVQGTPVSEAGDAVHGVPVPAESSGAGLWGLRSPQRSPRPGRPRRGERVLPRRGGGGPAEG